MSKISKEFKELEKEQTSQLKQVYYDPKTGYTGINELARKTKIKPDKVKAFLHQQDVYTLHKPIRKRFPRRKVFVTDIDEQWQADLVDMQEFAKFNENFKHLLTIIDCFSKYAWVIPLKHKTGEELKNAFELVFLTRKPVKLQTDKGTEFYNSKVTKLLKDNGIELFSSESLFKACIVERFNRTLKERMWKVFSHTNSYVWINILPDLVNNYNNSYHRSIKMSPTEASKPENSHKVFNNLYPIKESDQSKTEVDTRLKVGDKVRISRYKTVFDKGYLPNWTTEIFVIDEVLQTNPITYKIKDLADEEITGSFYEQDLVKFDKKDDVYKIEKIIRRRTNKTTGNKEIFVKWYGYPTVFNSWVPESDLV